MKKRVRIAALVVLLAATMALPVNALTVYWANNCNYAGDWVEARHNFTCDWDAYYGEAMEGSSIQMYVICTYYSVRPKLILESYIGSSNQAVMQYHFNFWANIKAPGGYDNTYNSNNNLPAIYLVNEQNVTIAGLAWRNGNTITALYGSPSVSYPLWHTSYSNSTVLQADSWHKYDLFVTPAKMDVYVDNLYVFSSVQSRLDEAPAKVWLQNSVASGSSIVMFDSISITDLQTYDNTPDTTNWFTNILNWAKSTFGGSVFGTGFPWWLLIAIAVVVILIYSLSKK